MNYAGQHPEKLTALVLVDVGPEMSGAGRERLRNFAVESQRLSPSTRTSNAPWHSTRGANQSSCGAACCTTFARSPTACGLEI